MEPVGGSKAPCLITNCMGIGKTGCRGWGTAPLGRPPARHRFAYSRLEKREDFEISVPTTNKGQKIDALLSDKTIEKKNKSVIIVTEGAILPKIRKGEKKMAKTVNLGAKYEHRLTLRLNDDQYDFIIKVSDILGVSPSDYLRMTINAGMVATKNNIESLSNGNALGGALGKSLEGAVGTNENVKTNINDIV